MDTDGVLRLWWPEELPYGETAHEAVSGYVCDPRNAFGFPVPGPDDMPRYRVLLSGASLLVEAWPDRRTVLTAYIGVWDRLIVQPGSGGRVFVVADNDEIEGYELRE